MKLYKTKKCVTTLVANLNQSNYNGTLFTFDPFDNRAYRYSVELSPHELLSTAKAALAKLEKIAGIEYRVFAKINKNDAWKSV